MKSTATAVWDMLTATARVAGTYGAKFKAWVLGSDNKSLLSTDAQTGVVLPRVTLVDTVTALTGNKS